MILMFCFLRGGICGMVALCWVVEINIYIYIYIYIYILAFVTAEIQYIVF
jgi:hypothetical protein